MKQKIEELQVKISEEGKGQSQEENLNRVINWLWEIWAKNCEDEKYAGQKREKVMREVLKWIEEGKRLGNTENGWGIKVGRDQDGDKCVCIGRFEGGLLHGEGI